MPVEIEETALISQGVGGANSTHQPHYLAWIAKWVSAHITDGATWQLRGSCSSASRQMLKAFPELKLVRGHVARSAPTPPAQPAAQPAQPADSDSDSGFDSGFDSDYEDYYCDPSNGHWWLETIEGEIVDPTAAQFLFSPLYYIAFDESKAHLLPTGKCPNCGDYCYNGKDLCSDDCAKAYAAYIMRECRL